ncbi:alpha/beta hydrolase, partial [Pseudomonas aeruginosa]|nr:alpha/beta hydrolase [Pseudomonas aeruginosa]
MLPLFTFEASLATATHRHPLGRTTITTHTPRGLAMRYRTDYSAQSLSSEPDILFL